MFAEFKAVHAAYDGVEVLRGINLAVSPGEMVGIIGPNGSGKSTLLKVLTGSLGLTQGAVLLSGRDISHLRARDRARMVGVVAQHSGLSFAFTVWDVVAMGRHSHLAPLRSLQESDRMAIRWALEQTDCMDLRDRLITELSGGEAQRVVIARALAQEPQGLLLDEPTNHLDLNHQLEIAHLLRELNQNREMTVIWVSHDLNLAAEFCDRIVAIGNGQVVADGTPQQVITSQLLHDLYQVNVPVIENPLSGRPQLVLNGNEGYAA